MWRLAGCKPQSRRGRGESTEAANLIAASAPCAWPTPRAAGWPSAPAQTCVGVWDGGSGVAVAVVRVREAAVRGEPTTGSTRRWEGRSGSHQPVGRLLLDEPAERITEPLLQPLRHHVLARRLRHVACRGLAARCWHELLRVEGADAAGQQPRRRQLGKARRVARHALVGQRDGQAARLARALQPSRAVLEDDAAARVATQPRRRLLEDVGRRLASSDLVAGDDGIH